MDQANSSMTEFQESQTVTLEWTVRNLKQLFENSKGEQKSKVVKSAVFGGGRWQVLFYPNSGHEGGGFISLYLSCEPTSDEKEKAMNGKWQREGLYKFTFELRSVNKASTFNTKEAFNHAFSWKTANWGWAQFARRDAVYYAPNTVRLQDAFVIVCQITSSPSAPVANPNVQSVPRSLMASVGNLLDDPLYSDVEFVLPARKRGGKTKKIWASKKLLSGRAEYFQTMFSSGFAEGASSGANLVEDESDYMNVHDDSDEEDAELEDMTWEISSDAESPADAPAPQVPGPTKTAVVVKDEAYVTYKSFLYYLYTDTIVFAPLKSQFLVSSPSAGFAQTLQLPTSSDGAPLHSPGIGVLGRSDSRRGWLKNWEANFPDRPVPCSAKAIYRLADKLDLEELKARAFAHITKSLSIQSVPFELFSGFSAAFAEIRKVQMDFALQHWSEIRSGDSMKQVLSELRSGRYPGYEEVMHQLLGFLEYRPSASDGSGNESGQEGMAGVGR